VPRTYAEVLSDIGAAAAGHNHDAAYAPIGKGVTNGDSHDHSGGDGAQIAYSTLSGLPTLGTAAACNTGTSSGNVPVLDGSGKLNTAVLPSLSLISVQTAANQTAQLALTAQAGDVCVRSDLNKSYIHNGGSAGTMADWTELLTPTDAVLSVAGRTGAVTLTATDVGLANVTNESKATMFTSAALTGTPTAPTAADGTSSTQIATCAYVETALGDRARTYSVSIGDGASTSYTVTHNLGTKDVIVQVYRVASPYGEVQVDIEHTSTTAVTIKTAALVASNALRVVVLG
jgi:hypothetical protein